MGVDGAPPVAQDRDPLATLPTARQSFNSAMQLAAALGVNLIPCTVPDRRPRVRWAALHSPRSPRVSAASLLGWASDAAALEASTGEPTAWALLPGSGRYAVIDVDRPGTEAEIRERFGDTPLTVRSPVPGHAHLWYRWPPGADIGATPENQTRLGYAVKARGCMIHAPHQIHKSGRGWYTCDLHAREWTAGLGARLPEFRLDELDADRLGRLDLGLYSGAAEDWAPADEAERRGLAWLEAAHPPEAGERESKTWRAAMSLGDFGVREDAAAAMILAWAQRGAQPRPDVETLDTVRRAFERRRLPGGCRRVADPGEVDADALFADLAGQITGGNT